ncbi:MAG: chemotaxis protein CheW [Desulfobulbus sp.]|jgi:chemotaxis signal transduction protein|uniref:chemotaxis protein CheW n=1 Tax=Desulfobulbus sp. TaxID=895 RepID=UPI0028450A37|nr:chemotaxis protein CheW [Desulfobulbus sp.]MDR2549881.1 chemotaxis protein CheW [Desulfobulbus sp.]
MESERQQLGLRSFLLPLAVNDSPGNFVCLFTQNQVVEILEPRFVLHVPGSPGYLAGVLLYHDSLLPVIDLDELCNRHQAEPRKRYRQLVVVRTGAADPETGVPLKAVVAVKAQVRIAKISGKELAETFERQEAPPSLNASGLVRGCFRRQDDAIALLDLGPVVRGAYATI